MERLPLFLPASNGDFRDAATIVGDDQMHLQLFVAGFAGLAAGASASVMDQVRSR
jgi:hypothetical protein